MNDDKTISAASVYPDQIADVFRSMRLGKHICRDDGVLFRDLEQHEDQYRTIFDHLGYALVRHGMGFYYLEGASTMTTPRLESLTLFVLLLFQHLEERKFENKERMWEKTLLSHAFAIAELPHFSTAEKRKMMNAVGVTPDTLHKKVLRVLASLGMLELLPQNQFRFRAPIYRFVDLCLRYASDEWAKQGESVESPAADEDADPTATAGENVADEGEGA